MSGVPEVGSADISLQAGAINAIVLGFATDPMTRWVLARGVRIPPDDASFRQSLRRPGIRARHRRHHRRDPGRRPVAAARVEPDDTEMGAVMEGALRPEIAEDVGAVMKGMAEHHPHEPHWYLPLIAADPKWIGRGL